MKPQIGLGDDRVFPEQLTILENIAQDLNNRTPLPTLIKKMKAMASCGDMRPTWGGDIARCLLHNGADQLILLSQKIHIRPWLSKKELLRDAWAVYKKKAVAVYL